MEGQETDDKDLRRSVLKGRVECIFFFAIQFCSSCEVAFNEMLIDILGTNASKSNIADV